MDRAGFAQQKLLNVYEKKFELPDSNIQITVVGRVTSRHKETYLYFREPASKLYFFMKYHEFCDFVASKSIFENHFKEAYDKVCQYSKKKTADVLTLPKSSDRKRKKDSQKVLEELEEEEYEESESEISDNETEEKKAKILTAADLEEIVKKTTSKKE